MIFGCANCHKYFQRYLPQLRGQSLYHMLRQIPVRMGKKYEPVALVDPCAAREAPQWYDDARAFLQRLGQPFQPLYPTAQDIVCCSFGGDIRVAAPALAKEMLEERIQRSTLPYLTYCTNCRDIYAAAGKESRHVLDLLSEADGGPYKAAPSLTVRRRNRERLKAELCRRFPGAAGAPETALAKNRLPLYISPELLRRMDQLLLTEDWS